MMENRIKEVMSDVFDIDAAQINEQSSIDTLENWESLTHLNFIMSLEEAFDISIEDEEMEKMIDFPTIKHIIENKLKG